MAKKGSQLKRFKESLSAVTQGTKAGPRRKTLSEKDPERKEKLKHIEQQFNAFDTKFSRSKHEVFGRKVKGKSGKPALSRELGEERVTSLGLWGRLIL
jgi:nucleolar protein 14